MGKVIAHSHANGESLHIKQRWGWSYCDFSGKKTPIKSQYLNKAYVQSQKSSQKYETIRKGQ